MPGYWNSAPDTTGMAEAWEGELPLWCMSTLVESPKQLGAQGVGEMVVEALHDLGGERCLAQGDCCGRRE